MDSLSLYYIYFLQLGFPICLQIVLGSSKRAKEEICIAELKAELRLLVKTEQWELCRLLCP